MTRKHHLLMLVLLSAPQLSWAARRLPHKLAGYTIGDVRKDECVWLEQSKPFYFAGCARTPLTNKIFAIAGGYPPEITENISFASLVIARTKKYGPPTRTLSGLEVIRSILDRGVDSPISKALDESPSPYMQIDSLKCAIWESEELQMILTRYGAISAGKEFHMAELELIDKKLSKSVSTEKTTIIRRNKLKERKDAENLVNEGE